MTRFKNTDEQDDLDYALWLLFKLVEFADIQEREGLIDGAADPSLYVDIAKELLDKYQVCDADESALQA